MSDHNIQSATMLYVPDGIWLKNCVGYLKTMVVNQVGKKTNNSLSETVAINVFSK